MGKQRAIRRLYLFFFVRVVVHVHAGGWELEVERDAREPPGDASPY